MKRRPRTSRPPAWAMILVAQVCADHGRRPPTITWYWSAQRFSSGHCTPSGHIHISAGTKVEDQILTVLHEVAHYLTKPRRSGDHHRRWHGKRFWVKAWELYARYDVLEFATSREPIHYPGSLRWRP